MRHTAIALLGGILLWASGCSTIVTALLIKELLDEKAPRRTWSGTVRDSAGLPVGGVLVQLRAEVEGDNDIVTFSDTTDLDGEYAIKFRWNKEVDYVIRVVHEGVVFAEENYGAIELSDQTTDFIIQGAVTTSLAGMVRGHDGSPLEGVLLVAATASGLGATPIVLLDDEAQPRYYITNDSGVFDIEGAVSRYGVICAYHPTYGFAYAYAEDDDKDGSIPLNIDMGLAGTYEVHVQVVDGLGTPVANTILAPSRQFRLRFSQPWNLGTVVDQVVSEQALFQGLVGNPSDNHPSTETIIVQATGANGIAENSEQISGGNYALSLLNINDDEPATALVTSENPLILHENTTVTVRVN